MIHLCLTGLNTQSKRCFAELRPLRNNPPGSLQNCFVGPAIASLIDSQLKQKSGQAGEPALRKVRFFRHDKALMFDRGETCAARSNLRAGLHPLELKSSDPVPPQSILCWQPTGQSQTRNIAELRSR
jgi:hypothetical protein